VGPPGLDSLIEQITGLLYPELDSRKPGYEITYHDVDDGSVVALGDAELTAVSVTHQQDHPSVGYRLKWGGKTVSFSGDASWCDGLLKLADGADLFICECCDFESSLPIHVSYSQIKAHADELRCEKLILTHCGPDVLARQEELDWPVAYDGMVLEL
jgi:ribonuclease BN (tRNA processing enzyme)